MSELLTSLAILLLIVAPAIGGLACLVLGKLKPIGKVVAATSAVLFVAVAFLAFKVITDGPVTIMSADLPGLGALVLAIDLVLMAVFAVVAWRARNVLMGAFVAVQLVTLLLLESGLHDQAGMAILIDQLSVLVALITSVIGSIICLYAVKYMEHYRDHGRFFAVMLLFLGAMNGAVFSNDLVWLFMFWEVTTLCSFLLIGHTRTEQARASALTAALYTLGGGAALVLGAALCFHYFGTTYLDQLPAGEGIAGLALLPLALLALAAFTKSAQVPFQKWLLGAMVAPTPVSALLHSATMVNLGVYLLLRLSSSLSGTGYLVSIIGLVGAASFLITAVLAMTQSNAKRILAYSTVGNLGLIVACVGLDSSLALTAGMLFLLYHAISKALLFMSVGVAKEELGSEDIEAMEGLRDTLPAVAAGIFVGVFMMVLPQFGMFASKWLLSEAVASAPVLALLLVIGFGATVVYYAKWLGKVLTAGAGKGSSDRGRLPRRYIAALGATALIGVAATALIGAVVEYLANPFVSSVFEIQIAAGPGGLETPQGALPIFLLMIMAAVMAVLFLRRRRERQNDPIDVYTCGEGGETRTGSFYFWSEARVARLTRQGNLVAAVMLLAMTAVPLLEEVIG